MTRHGSRLLRALLAVSACMNAAPATAQTAASPNAPEGADEPLLDTSSDPWRLIYPQDARIPRNLTANERRFIERYPITPPTTPRGLSVNPSGPVHCVAEYEPMQAIVVSWTGGSSITSILAQMGAQITTTGGAELWVVAGSASIQSSATTSLTNAGANMSKVKFFIRTLDSVWMRDYGPRYIYEGDCRAIVDHTYNRPRPNDDAFSQWLGPTRRHTVYDIPLVHGGGNYHLSGLGDSWATRLIANENPGLTESQIVSEWHDLQNVNTTLTNPFAAALDSTQHIDMWMQVLGDRKVAISDWPVKTTTDTMNADALCEATASLMAGPSYGYTVTRIPARQVSGIHYTYANVVLCNNLALVPSYTNSTIVSAGYNTQALNAWKTAWGDDGVSPKKVVQIGCEAIVSLAGVMHCIVMHVPAHRGGLNPTAYVKTPNGGQSFTPGQQVAINWLSDDDTLVTLVDIHLSTDAGATWQTVALNRTPYTGFQGTYTWTVPDVTTTRARIRITARDAQNNTGSDISDANFTILGTLCPSDVNADGFTDAIDYDQFIGAWLAGNPSADYNGDEFTDAIDYDQFMTDWLSGC